mmetsp:Transcript_23296/g.22886  ORF Transcript_23296/g.22886 Transcript_23296/m.22886 type:complete len:104 (+) Transcript_23296:608-919(+)
MKDYYKKKNELQAQQQAEEEARQKKRMEKKRAKEKENEIPIDEEKEKRVFIKEMMGMDFPVYQEFIRDELKIMYDQEKGTNMSSSRQLAKDNLTIEKNINEYK